LDLLLLFKLLLYFYMSEHKITFTVGDEQLPSWIEYLNAAQFLLGSITPIVEVPDEEPRYFGAAYLSSFLSDDGEVQGLKAHTLRTLGRNFRKTKNGGYGALPNQEECAEPMTSTWDTQGNSYVDSFHSTYLEFAAQNYDSIRQLGEESANDIKIFLAAHGLWHG
jgi:hypothetical protein